MKTTKIEYKCDKCLKEFCHGTRVVIIQESTFQESVFMENKFVPINGGREERHYHYPCYVEYWRNFGSHNA